MRKPCLKCKEHKAQKDFNPRENLYCLKCLPFKKSRAAKCVLRVSFDKENKRLLTILHRDIGHLMDISHAGTLKPEESTKLVSYLKLVGELEAIKLLKETEKEIQK